MYHSFETDRLILKPTSIDDASFFLELYNTPKWIQFIGDRNVRTIEQAEDWIRTKIMPQFERLGYGNYVVIRKADGVKMGASGLYDREGVDGIDIGFAFLPQYERQGYAFEAATRIKEAAFNTFSLEKLSAIATVDNIASQRLLEKLGFTLQKRIVLPNDDVELVLYEHKSWSNR